MLDVLSRLAISNKKSILSKDHLELDILYVYTT